MKYLSSFNKFDKINEEEGWKENILVGLLSLLGVTGMGQNKSTSDKRVYHAKTEQSMKNMVRQGWSLDSTQVDTLWKEVQVKKPNTLTMVTKLRLDKDQYFASGKFVLSNDVKDSIQTTLSDISNASGIITDISVESSTDKQGLSINLQNQLKSMRYSSDNKGLSKARSEAVTNYLTELGVNDSLVTSEQKWEMGEDEIEQGSRYVTIDISYLIVDESVTPSETEDVPQVKKTYWLSSDVGSVKTPPSRKWKFGYSKTHKNGPIKNHNRGHKKCVDKCYFSQSGPHTHIDDWS
jgi:outer membrane protein OmpA-like peptidoglycan-associated protein